MFDLPYEIWLHIATFLPPQKVKALLSVNRALHDIAMNERYRTCSIGPLSNKDTQRNLKRLIDHDIAARVRSLIFKPRDIAQLLKESPPHDSADESRKTDKGSFSTIMKQLSSLTTLRVDINGAAHFYLQKNPEPFISQFSLGWASFHRTLHSLDMRVPIEDIAVFLPKEKMECLEIVSIQIIRSTADAKAREKTILGDAILPFLQSHRRTLRSLTLDSVERTNLTPLLGELDLPGLTHFKLVQPHFNEGEADYSGLQHFFETHGTLTRLEIVVYPSAIYDPSDRFNLLDHACFAVPLPKLEHLALQYTYSVDADGVETRNPLVSYIQQFKGTLRSLRVSGSALLRVASAKALVESFAASGRLMHLDISVKDFSPELFTVMAESLPNLETLALACDNVWPTGRVYNTERNQQIPQFAKDMYEMYFPEWRLRSLNMNIARYFASPADGGECERALLAALPNVEKYCGYDRQTLIHK